jgi:pimeloyl-ACP methyl ester carboxylesterase
MECDLSGARLAWRETGAGPAIIALHGFSETADYWWAAADGQASIADQLGRSHRVIALDMRGHGRTVVADPDDPAAMAVGALVEDVFALARHLSLPAFHLLGHATGSVVAIHAALARPAPILSLAVTNGASATAMMTQDPAENARFFDRMASFYEHGDWETILASIRRKPWPFLHALDKAANASALWPLIEAIFRQNDPRQLARFARAFYTNTDRRLDALADLAISALVVISEQDDLMREPSRAIADAIAGARWLDIPSAGHMTALECPEVLGPALVEFFAAADRP